MNLFSVVNNHVLLSVLIAWALTQGVKVPLDYFTTHKCNWALLFSAGGMPSSHAALITAAAHAIGLYIGFDTPLFGLAFALAMIIIYDATGIRRQAGMHARKINVIIDELLSGHAVSEKQLREVLGHTPLEALGGVLLGLVVTQLLWLVWR